MAATLVFLLLSAAASAAAEPPLAADDYLARGMQKFRQGQVAGALADFNEAAEIDPNIEPRLWQRGICYYYLGEYEKGRNQFVVHRTVNPNDVENAAWHFCCVARLDGIDAARKSLIKLDATRDRRTPMAEIYQLYAGDGTEQTVLDAAQRSDKPRAQMYAQLYLGLYQEAQGNAEAAWRHLEQAVAVEMSDHYMQDVAKVHLLVRAADKGK